MQRGFGRYKVMANIRQIILVRAGAHTIGMVVTIPMGSTATAMKPNIVSVANAIVPKLR